MRIEIVFRPSGSSGRVGRVWRVLNSYRKKFL